MKTHNEYKDKLCNPLISEYLKKLGCNIHSPECWIVDEEIKENHIDHLRDAWSGLIGDGLRFHSYRYTNSFVQTWLRENYNIHIFIGWRPNVKKWDSHHYSLDMSPKEYMKKRDMTAYKSDKLFDTYEEALESGIISALEDILKEKVI